MDQQWRPGTSSLGASRRYLDDDDEEDREEGYDFDPLSNNYQLLVNRGSSCEEDDEEDRQGLNCEYDESITPVSSDSDDSSQGKVESHSQVLFGNNSNERGFQPSSEFDEEHKVESSSSDSSPMFSPRQQPSVPPTNNTNRYSRHLQSSAAPCSTANVDDGIRFFQTRSSTFNSPSHVPSQPSTFGSAPYNYTGFNRSSSGANLGRPQSNAVRGMAVPPTSSSDVCLDMPNDENIKCNFVPGGSLHKTASSKHTRDGSPVLSHLDQGQGASRERYDLSHTRYRHMTDYEDRYGNTDSLEHQHPSRTANASVDASRPTHKTALLASGVNTTSYNSISTSGQEVQNPKLAKKQERKKKKAEMEKKSWRTADDQLGKMDVDDILAELGETIDTNGKKKKKEQKRVSAVDKKKDSEVSDSSKVGSKKKDNQSKISKKKQNKQASAAENGSISGSGQFSGGTSDIIQTTSNNRVVSRIILNGRSNALAASDFSERNIDEEIAKRKASLKEIEDDCINISNTISTIDNKPPPVTTISVPASDDPPLLIPDEDDFENLQVGQPAQNIDVTYNINLNQEPFWVEEELVRVVSPQPIEEEFKQVVHKKKKPHVKQQGAERDANAVVGNHTNHMISTKTGSKAPSKPRPPTEHKIPATVSSQRPTSPSRKISEVVKDVRNASEENEYDFSEKSFPLLSGNHKQPINDQQQTVPTQNSWAAKVASISSAASQKNLPKNVGDGDHLTNETFPVLQPPSTVSKVQPNDSPRPSSWDKQVDITSAAVDELTEPCKQATTERVQSEVVVSKEVQSAGDPAASLDTGHATLSPDACNESVADGTVTTTKKICTEDEVLANETSQDGEPYSSPLLLAEFIPLGASESVTTAMVQRTKADDTVNSDVHVDCISNSLPASVPNNGTKVTKKSTGVVEFVGRSFLDDGNSTHSNIQFGFDFDEEMEPKFDVNEGAASDVLTHAIHVGTISFEAVDSETSVDAVDILPMLLSGKTTLASHCDVDYPSFLHRIVRMLRKEWLMTNQALELSPRNTTGRHRHRKVKRWSAVMD